MTTFIEFFEFFFEFVCASSVGVVTFFFGEFIEFIYTGFVNFFNLTGVEAGVMFIQASMPSAVLTFLVAKIYSPKKISDNVASTVALSTFLSFFTLIVVVFISLKYFS